MLIGILAAAIDARPAAATQPMPQWLAVSTAVAQVIVGVVALISLWFSRDALSRSGELAEMQRKHNHTELAPVPYIAIENRATGLSIELRNNGLGPMLITKFVVIDLDSGEEKGDIFSFLPKQTGHFLYDQYAVDIVDRVIPANGSISLIRYFLDENHIDNIDYKNRFLPFLRAVKTRISNLELTIGYTDLYQNDFESHQRSLTFMSPVNSVDYKL